VLALLPMQRRAEFEQRMIAARRTAEELARAHAELLDRRDAEVRENAAMAERLRELATRLEADHAERARATARSLHEDVAQDIASIRLSLDALRRSAERGDADAQLDSLERLATQALSHVRDLSYDLYPAVLEHADVAGSMRAAARSAEENFGIDVRVTVAGDVPPLEREPKLVLYRFVEEALRNAVRHGRAETIEVAIVRSGDRLAVHVADDGVGAASTDGATTGGVGLLAARERLRRLGGDLAVEPRAPSGLCVSASLPAPPVAG
jgi:signal transduction histidine kinase